jgi:hypothetical protein
MNARLREIVRRRTRGAGAARASGAKDTECAVWRHDDDDDDDDSRGMNRKQVLTRRRCDLDGGDGCVEERVESLIED